MNHRGAVHQAHIDDRVDAQRELREHFGGRVEPLRPVVEELQLACDERRQLFSQTTIHGWLHGWLCIHVPLSVTLLVLGVLHVIMSVYY